MVDTVEYSPERYLFKNININFFGTGVHET